MREMSEIEVKARSSERIREMRQLLGIVGNECYYVRMQLQYRQQYGI